MFVLLFCGVKPVMQTLKPADTAGLQISGTLQYPKAVYTQPSDLAVNIYIMRVTWSTFAAYGLVLTVRISRLAAPGLLLTACQVVKNDLFCLQFSQ